MGTNQINFNRGEQYNEEFATQRRDYSGLKYGKITPTDIDGYIDFNNELFIFFELKYNDAPMPYGQQLALERLCKACKNKHRDGIHCYLFLASHNTLPPNKIIAHEAIVIGVYMIKKNGIWEWKQPQIKNITLKRAIDRIRLFHKLK